MGVEPIKINTGGVNLDSFDKIYSNKYDAASGANVLKVDKTKAAYENAELELFQVDADNDGKLDDVFRIEKIDANGNRTAMGFVNGSEAGADFVKGAAEKASEAAPKTPLGGEQATQGPRGVVYGTDTPETLPEIPTDGGQTTGKLPEIPTDGGQTTGKLPEIPTDRGQTTGKLPEIPTDGGQTTGSQPSGSSALPSAGAGVILDTSATGANVKQTDGLSIIPTDVGQPSSSSSLPSAGAGAVLAGESPVVTNPAGNPSSLPSAGAGAVLDGANTGVVMQNLVSGTTAGNTGLPSAGVGAVLGTYGSAPSTTESTTSAGVNDYIGL